MHVWIGEGSKAPDEHYQRASQNIRLAARYANPVKTRATIDGPVVFRNEWDLGLFSALGADDRMHLAGRALRAATISTFRTTAGAAFGATTGLIQQPFLLVKLLLTRGEHEFLFAVTAYQGLVLEAHCSEVSSKNGRRHREAFRRKAIPGSGLSASPNRRHTLEVTGEVHAEMRRQR